MSRSAGKGGAALLSEHGSHNAASGHGQARRAAGDPCSNAVGLRFAGTGGCCTTSHRLAESPGDARLAAQRPGVTAARHRSRHAAAHTALLPPLQHCYCVCYSDYSGRDNVQSCC
eukprot:355593-Chlamydomonas_euryale.AAC.5